MSDYYTQIKGIWEELDNMVDLPKVSVANEEIANFLRAFGKMQEEQKLFQFLNGLDDVYKAQRSQILIMNPLPSVEVACSILQQEELQREVLEDEQFVHESSALYGRSLEAVSSPGVENRCSHCGNKGHVKEKCWQILGYPRWHPRSKKFPQVKPSKDNAKGSRGRSAAHVESASFTSTEGGLSLTSQQVEQLLKLLPQSTRASTETEDDDLEQSFAGNVYCSCASIKTSDWILDTGATDHMTPVYKNLVQAKECIDSVHINLPDGSSAHITHKGQVHLANHLVLQNTLCVPSFRFNLLSISKLTEDNHCIVLFYPKFCLIQDCVTGKLKGLGRQQGGLYYLVNADVGTSDARFSAMPLHVTAALDKMVSSAASLVNNFHPSGDQVTSSESCVLHQHSSYSLWHYRLGHAPVSKLKYIVDVPSDTSDSVCVACPMEKMFRLPFYQSCIATTSIFELVHVDIWGPYRVPTHENCRFFLTLVDDFSRATWTYLLQCKSQAVNVLKQFYAYIHTQFGKHLKAIRSDNALEFTEGSCNEFFAANGIVHQRSCVDRPQQNGIIERKHRHILEIARALRFQAALPIHFWGDCVMTATHIINRLPTPVLRHKTPYEVLLNKIPDF